MLREKLDELLKSEFSDESEIKKDSIEKIRGNINFTEEKASSTYYFTTQNASYELTLRYDIELSGSARFESVDEGLNVWYNKGDYKIESLKLRN